MADLSYNSYLKKTDNKATSKSSSLSYDTYLKSKEPKQSVGQKIEGFAKAIVSPVATMVARPIQLGSRIAGVSDDKINEITNKTKGWIAPTPQNVGDVVKDVGRGIQTAALGLTGGGSTIGKMALTGAKEGAIFGAGSALERLGTGAISKEGLKEVASSAAIGSVLNPIVGTIAKKVAGKFGKKDITNGIEKTDSVVSKIDEISDNSLSKTDDSIKSAEVKQQSLVKDVERIPPGEIIKKESNIEDAIFQEAKKYKSADEFMKAQDEYLYHNSSARNLDSIKKEGLSNKYDGGYNHGNKDIPDEKPRIYFAEDIKRATSFGGGSNTIPELRPLTFRVKKSVLGGDIYKAEKLSGGETWYFGKDIKPSDLEVFENGKWEKLSTGKSSELSKSQLEEIWEKAQTKTESRIGKDVERISNDIPEIESYKPGTFDNWSKTIRSLDNDEIKRVAMGGEKTINNDIPKNAYLSVMKNIAEETGDVKLAKELAISNVSSKSGQELVSSKIAYKENVTDTLRDIRLSKLKKFNVKEDDLIKQAESTVKDIQGRISDISKVKPSINEVKEIIRDLICK